MLAESDIDYIFTNQTGLLILSFKPGAKNGDTFFKRGASLSLSREQGYCTSLQQNANGFPLLSRAVVAQIRNASVCLSDILERIIVDYREVGLALTFLDNSGRATSAFKRVFVLCF